VRCLLGEHYLAGWMTFCSCLSAMRCACAEHLLAAFLHCASVYPWPGAVGSQWSSDVSEGSEGEARLDRVYTSKTAALSGV
jgi:hypothetical protein